LGGGREKKVKGRTEHMGSLRHIIKDVGGQGGCKGGTRRGRPGGKVKGERVGLAWNT